MKKFVKHIRNEPKRFGTKAAYEWAQTAAWYAQNGYYVIHFTYLIWQNGFAFQHINVIKNRLIQVNREHPIVVEQQGLFDLAKYMCTPGDPYVLEGLGWETCCLVKEASGYCYQVKGADHTLDRANAETIWYDDTYIYRGADTSDEGGKVYIQSTGTRYGAVWAKRYMKPGDIFPRSPTVSHFLRGGQPDTTKPAPKVVNSFLKFVAHHPSYTFFNGNTVQDVIELSWVFNANDPPTERYFYAGGRLVGFVGTLGRSALAKAPALRAPKREVLAWIHEPVPPPVEKVIPVPPVNIPASPGEGAPMRVRAVGLNMRANHSTSAAVVRQLAVNETVTIYPDTTTPLIDKFSWVYLITSKDKGWCAVRGAWGESFTPLSTPKLELIMPTGCDVVITSRFGVPRDYDGDGILDDKHEGLDVAPAHKNCSPLILAGAAGIVDEVSTKGSYGNHIKLRHIVGTETFITWYCHLEHVFVKAGDSVKQGDYIGVMGTTGNSSGVHLHLNVQHIGRGQSGFVIPDAVDPLSYISSQTLSLVA